MSTEPTREVAELERRDGAVRDGIGEEDNAIPAWWWWGFIATVLFAAFYIPYYMLSGWSQRVQYQEQVYAAQARAEEVQASLPTHNPYGSGLVGPSLVDPYWKYGSDDASRFETISKGRPGGMPAWGTQLGTEKIWKVMAYLDTLPKSDKPGVGSPGYQASAPTPTPPGS
jgi:cytochrome c oxidase cbb3-type subunit 3